MVEKNIRLKTHVGNGVYDTLHPETNSKIVRVGNKNLDETLGEVTTQLADKANIADLPSSAYTFKGSATFALLPTTGNVLGDVYYVIDNLVNYAWTGTTWTPIGNGAFANGSVVTSKLADSAVTDKKLAKIYAPAIKNTASGTLINVSDYATVSVFDNTTGKQIYVRNNQWFNSAFNVISGTNNMAFISATPVKIIPNVPFTVGFPEAGIAKYILIKDSAGTTLVTGPQNAKSFTFTVAVTEIFIQINGNITFPDMSQMMLSYGSVIAYEPYIGEDVAIGAKGAMGKYIFAVDNSTISIEYTVDTKAQIDKVTAAKALNYPFVHGATRKRTAYGDALIASNTILELVVNGSNTNDYYIYNLYNVPSGRQIQIRNNKTANQIVFTATQTVVSSQVEKCVFDNGKGYVVVDWSKIGGAGVGYAIGDTQIAKECIMDSTNKLSLTLNDDYYATVGVEFNIYNDNVIWTNNRNRYYYEWVSTNTRMIPFDERLSFTPTNDDVGDVSVTLNVLENIEDNTAINVIATKTITIHVMADSMPSTPKKIMFFGDSLTENGNIQKLVKDTYGINAVLVGTQGTDPYKHEGRGGWGTWNYKSQATFNGKSNPFFNPATSLFDFGYYMANSGVAKPDIVNIFLGTNNGYSIDSAENGIVWFVDKIKAYDPTIIVTVMSAHLTPDSNDGYAIKAKATTNNAFQSNMRAINFTKKVNELLGGRELEGIYVIPIHINIDRVNDYEFEEKAVSSRNPTTVKRLVDNVHFYSPYGYHKLADVWYAYSKQFINQ